MSWRVPLVSIGAVALVLQCAGHSSSRPGAGFVIIGHRGNPAAAPENTLASIASAFSIGCDLAEVDVRRSRDGVAVILHDETVDRTTNGHGAVADLTLAQLKTLDAGSWRGPEFAGERIPTLAEAVAAARGKGRLLLDVPVGQMGQVIADVLQSLDLPVSSALVATWDDQAREDMASHLRGATIIRADSSPPPWDDRFFAEQQRAGVRVFDVGDAPPRFIGAAQARGMPVWVWTVDDEATMRRLMREGVNGFETNVPGVALRLARELGIRR